MSDTTIHRCKHLQSVQLVYPALSSSYVCPWCTIEQYATEISALKAQCEKLRAFANAVMDCWPDGDVDGGFLQEEAIHHGLLAPHEVTEPCNPDGCQCAEYGDFPQICYRRTSILDAVGKETK